MYPIIHLGPLPWIALLLDPMALRRDATRVVCRAASETASKVATLLHQPRLSGGLHDRFKALLRGQGA